MHGGIKLLERRMRVCGELFYDFVSIGALIYSALVIRYVLPNHFLFLLAERLPRDMAQLLAIFSHSVPPVIRRRAGELLDCIRGCVARHVAVESPVVDVTTSSDTRLEGREVQVVKPSPIVSDRLWSLPIANDGSYGSHFHSMLVINFDFFLFRAVE